MADKVESEAAATAAETPPKRSWWRRIVGRGGRDAPPLRRWSVVALVILACLGILASAVAIWVHMFVFNTDTYVKTVAPIGKDPAVTAAVATSVTDWALQASDLQTRIQTNLPSQMGFLAQPITDQVRTFLDKKVNEFLNSQQAYDLWLKLNTVAHERLVAILRHQNGTVVQLNGNQVQLNLIPVISYALGLVNQYMPQALASHVTIPQIDPTTPPDQARAQLSAAIGRPLPADFGVVTIFQGDKVTQLQQAVKLFDALVIAVVVITVLLIAAALVLSPWRLRTLVELGLGTLLAVVLARFAIHQVQTWIYNTLTSGQGVAIARDMVGSIVDSLQRITRWLFVGGLVVVVAAFLAGRPQWFKAAGHGVSGAAGKGASMAGTQLPAAQHLAATHTDYLCGGGLVAAVIALFFASPSLAWVISVIVLLVLWEGGVLLLARRGAGPAAAA